MLEINEVTYAAVITITLPGSDEVTNITVTLTPAAAVPTGGGRLKPLRECTLNDLQQFADALEEELWLQHQAVRLEELANDSEAQIAITIVDDQPSGDPAEKSWLEHQIVFPAEMVEEPAEEVAPAEEPAPDMGDATSAAVDDETVGEAEDAAAEEETEVETPAEAAPEPDEEEALDDQVSVAESELVHAEREAQPQIEAPQTEHRLRIAGRRRPLGHSTWTAVDILVNEPAFRDAQAHALTSLRREVAGFLIGPPPEKQPDGRYVVHISDTIIGKHTRMHGASVTYTPESWRYVNDKLAEMYPDETAVIVGWYHTHPNFGIFLSGMDQFIHQNFFTQIWHVALVLDPVNRQSGFFCWDRPRARVDRYEFPWPDWAAGSW